MKKLRMIISAAIVISIVSSALAFKVPNQKLWVCDCSIDKCIKPDNNDYRLGSTIEIKCGALTEQDLSTAPTCAGYCDLSLTIDIEN